MNTLTDLSSIILSEKSYPGDLFKATRSLYALFSKESGITIEEFNNESTQVKNGFAVSPGVAAYCMIDIMRTQKFSQALLSAINDKSKEITNRKIRVLYAGCGPYATLFSVIAPFLDDTKVEFTLMDVHQDVLDSSKKMLTQFGFENLIKSYICEDASTYIIDASEKPDIILSETMTAGLLKEPQVSIMINLLKQSEPETLFIPENVKLSVHGFRLQKDQAEGSVPQMQGTDIGLIFDMRKAIDDAIRQKNTSEYLQGETLKLSTEFDYYKLSTSIDLYNEIELLPLQSSLTLYRKIEKKKKKGDTVKATYNINEHPRLLLESISQSALEPSH